MGEAERFDVYAVDISEGFASVVAAEAKKAVCLGKGRRRYSLQSSGCATRAIDLVCVVSAWADPVAGYRGRRLASAGNEGAAASVIMSVPFELLVDHCKTLDENVLANAATQVFC